LQLAIAVQAVALILLLSHVPMNLLWRLALGALVMSGLYLGIYLPLATALHGFVIPLPVSNFLDSPTIRSGDGVLYEGRWLRPKTFARGDLVVYDIPTAVSGHVWIAAGFGLDRILGLPGEHVRVSHGVVTIDGSALDASVGPLGSSPQMPTLDVTLRGDEYFIVPSRLNLTRQGNWADQWWNLAPDLLVVPADRVRGRVIWRTWPWSRWGRVE
jgi:type IV secretory pathway protease TraF